MGNTFGRRNESSTPDTELELLCSHQLVPLWKSAWGYGKKDEEDHWLFLETPCSTHYRCQRKAEVGQLKQIVKFQVRKSLICVEKDYNCK